MPMNVILLERVPKLGQMGDVVKVKPGFARNFLLPQKKALRATKDNITYFESQRKVLEAQNLERRQEAEAVGAKMSDLKVTIIRQASEALQLYGSVTSRDIADGAGTQGVKIERSQVELDKPIKALGEHKIKIHLHPEVVVEISVLVARSAEEAEFLAKGGRLVAETERAAMEAAEAAQRAADQAAALFEAKSAEGAEGEGEAADAEAGEHRLHVEAEALERQQRGHHHEGGQQGLPNPRHERRHGERAFARHLVQVVEQGGKRPPEAPEDHQRERDLVPGAKVVVHGRRQLQHPQGGEQAEDHDERRRRPLERREHLVVEGRLGARGQTPQRGEEQPGDDAPRQQRDHHQEEADRIVGHAVAARPEVERGEDQIHPLFQVVGRVGRPAHHGGGGGGRGV